MMRQAQSNYLRLNFVAQKGIEVATFICNFTSSSLGHYCIFYNQILVKSICQLQIKTN